MRWFRFYAETLDNAKVQQLSAKIFKLWVNLLCVGADRAGELPELSKLAFRIREPETQLSRDIQTLIEQNLVDVDSTGTYMLHDWNEWQRETDVSTDRVRRYREKMKRDTKRNETVTETPSEENRIEQIQKQSVVRVSSNGKDYEPPPDLWPWFSETYPGQLNLDYDCRVFVSVIQTPDDAERLRANLPLWCASPGWEQPRYVPKAENFLSKRQWRNPPKQLVETNPHEIEYPDL